MKNWRILEMNRLISNLEKLRLWEDTKALKEPTSKFSSKLIDHVNHISILPTYFEERIGNMSFNNRVGDKTEAANFELEKTIKKKIY